jgi:hypothetical protein
MSDNISSISKFLNIIGSQRDNLTTKQSAKIAPQENNKTNADILTLSPTLNTLQQFLSMNDSNNDADNGEISLTGLEQLKQQGDMLANMLQLKIKNFETDLLSTMKNIGVDQSNPIDIKKNSDGLNIINDIPNKSAIQNLIQNEQFGNQFQDIATLSTLINTIQQLQNQNPNQNTAGAKYAQFSLPNQTAANNNYSKKESDFILHILASNGSTM